MVAQWHSSVKEKNADLILMVTHGRTGISRLIMDSVAEGVMKNSAVPVMCVNANQESPDVSARYPNRFLDLVICLYSETPTARCRNIEYLHQCHP